MAKKRFARPTAKASRITTIPKGFRIRTYEQPPPGFNPLTAAPRLLLRYGFPTRPDAKTAPELLKRWEAVFSRPRTWITPEFYEVKGKYHGPAKGPAGKRMKRADFRVANATSSNWSGSVASPPLGHTFGWVSGQWTVPNPHAPGVGRFYASEWIGIDGTGSPDVLQAGTETEAADFVFYKEKRIYAWWEWYPAGEVAITNFPVSAGDIMYGLICVNSTSTATVYLSNQSTNVLTRFSITAPSGTTLVGNSAEWIVERPAFSDETGLADFKVDYFDEGIAGLSDVFQTVTLGSGTPYTMTNSSGAELSVPTIETTQLMKVNWLKAN